MSSPDIDETLRVDATCGVTSPGPRGALTTGPRERTVTASLHLCSRAPGSGSARTASASGPHRPSSCLPGAGFCSENLKLVRTGAFLKPPAAVRSYKNTEESKAIPAPDGLAETPETPARPARAAWTPLPPAACRAVTPKGARTGALT